MAIVFPGDCTTPSDRTEYCYRAQELLRKAHNVFGKWHREGITLAVYNQLPQDWRDIYSYTASTLSDNNWEDFQTNIFRPISEKIGEKLLQYRVDLKDSVRWTINVEDIQD